MVAQNVCASTGRDRRRRISCIPSIRFFRTALLAVLLIPVSVQAQAGSCARDGDAWICTGEFPAGLTMVAADGITTLDLADVLGQIDPEGQYGVYFYSVTGGQITLVTGSTDTDLQITTNDNSQHGVVALSVGGSAGGVFNPQLGVLEPASGGSPGGPVIVENNANITTNGAGAVGIIATNQIGGYHPAVIASLQNFDPDAIAYEVVSVDGDVDNVGVEIAGSSGGAFILNADGSYSFDPGTIFDDIEDGEELSTSITYFVNANNEGLEQATLTVTRSFDRDGNLQTLSSVSFDGYNIGGLLDNESLFPDMQTYIDRLLADAGVGGIGQAIVVINNGNITTWGVDAHGIASQTISGTGSAGIDGNFWGRIPTAGDPGANGGAIEITNDGDIVTNGDGAVGIVATSRGGTGGRGGEGSTWRYGRAGGEGGRGGDVFVNGDGNITTDGDHASGIIAVSEGGIGGLGGEGVGFTGGALGGHGGDAGSVTISGSMNITTDGIASHGMWARSIGGSGGRGGATGWIGTASAGGGGGASDGGLVTILMDGQITTLDNFSHGVVGQSIGGFGGYGGTGAGLFVGWGGAGGGAGSGGDVNIGILGNGTIFTAGNFSHGVFAQSIGGGGGDGGAGGGIVGVGGSGGAGGLGGKVDVSNWGGITTIGDVARGIYAQSIGGGGGDGGDSGGALVAVGGSGDGGGNGGNVTVDNFGMIMTGIDDEGMVVGGWRSTGIFAQSVGGGGGDGGFSGAGAIAVGGSGALGGLGGAVSVNNYGTIISGGDNANTIFAQSVGGGGGNGGSSVAGIAAIGGGGGDGNFGGIVIVLNEGWLASYGSNSAAIFAQSVGGGGGNGGSATALNLIPLPISFGFALGGDGASGGNGRLVTVDNSGNIMTAGSNSHAIMAQSVGGSGGTGGTATTVSLAASIPGIDIPTINAQVTLGGDGGDGGDAGAVEVENSGEVTTTGFRSYGVYAQSVGGSGGDGGNATSISLNFNADDSGSVTIGGDGHAGGIGNTVTVESAGLIHTLGDYSNAVFAQSVGGSGGAGGDATSVSVSMDIPLGWDDLIPTPSMSFELTVGGDGGSGGIGGDVTVENIGTIITEGEFATAVMAQSVGGSGGIGGEARSFTIDLTANPTDFIPWMDAISFDTRLIFGGDGGSGGHAGIVNVANEGDIVTTGAFSHGIVAQSVGGGGGVGGSVVTFDFSTTDIIPDIEIPILDDIVNLSNINMVLEGSGGSGGNGGDVTLNSIGNVWTEGDFAMGVVAQSIAGGGGLAGMYNPQGVTDSLGFVDMVGLLLKLDSGISFAGSLGADGNAGAVFIDHNGNIQTTGIAAHGLLAQSAAGMGTSGNVDVILNGSIFASGDHSSGIFAQSGGGAGNGDITVMLDGGTIMGGSAGGAGIVIVDGAANSIWNNGVITSVPGIDGQAILAFSGNEFVENYGTVTGSVDLGLGANSFENYGLVNAGSNFNMGVDNLLLNAGDFAPGGVMNVFTTSVLGDFEQTDLGTLWIDLTFDFGLDAWDFLTISGLSDLNGTVGLVLLDTGNIMPGEWEAVLISSAGGITEFGLNLDAPASAVIDYALMASSDTDYSLFYNVDFAPSGLTNNQAAMGEHFNDIQLSGSTEIMKPLTSAIVVQPDIESLAAAYDLLSPHIYTVNQIGRLFSSLDFEQAMHSCKVRDGDLRFSREGECAWMRVSDRDINYEARGGGIAASDYRSTINMGVQRALSEHWHGGLAMGLEKTDYEIPLVAERDGRQVQAGAIVKGRYGANALNFSMIMGRGDFETRRSDIMADGSAYLSSKRHVRFYSTHAGYGYNLGGDSWFVQPGLDLGWTNVSGDPLDEQGFGPTALHVQKTDDKYLTSRLDLRIGGEFSGKNQFRYRPFILTSYTHVLSGTTNEISARLNGAPDNVSNFTQILEVDDNYTRVSLGIDIFGRENWAFSFAYDRQFADSWDAHSFFAKVMFEI